MNITINSKDLARAIGRVQPAADRKGSISIMECALLTAEGGSVSFAATDLYQSITTSAPATVKTPGACALSAKTLLAIARQLPVGDATIKVGDDFRAVITVGKTRFSIPGQPPRDMPAIADPGSSTFVDIAADDLARALALTSYAMSSESTKPQLCGSLFDIKDGVLRVLASDGHRMSKSETKFDAADRRVIVPSKAVLELKRLADDASGSTIGVAFANGLVFFRHDGNVIASRLVDDVFPPWERLIPKSSKSRVVLSRVAFISALKRMSLVVDEKAGSVVKLTVSAGTMRIGSENRDVGDGYEDLDVDYAGADSVVGFSARYLLDVLAAMPDDDVAFEFSGSDAQGVLTAAQGAGGFVGIVMPIRLGAA